MGPLLLAPSPSSHTLTPRRLLSPSLPISAPTPIMAAASSQSQPQTPPHPHPNRILVCGGGVIGACTAYFLAQKSSAPQPQITLLEKSSVACAASGKAGGFLALDWCDGGPVGPLARASFALHRSLADSLGGAHNYGYRPLTTLSLPLTGNNTTNIKPAPAGALPPWVDGPAGAPRTIGTADTTAQVHPQLFTRTLVDAAKRDYGVEVLIGAAEEVRVEGGKVTGVVVKESGGRERVIEAEAVVLALGPWSSRSPIVSTLCNVSGLKAHSIVLRPPEPAAITPHALFLSYQDSPTSKMLDPEVYPRPTGEVYICGMSGDAEVPDDPEEITGDPASIEMLHKIAGRVSTHLRKDSGAELVAEQACFLPCTDDGLPIIGEIPSVKGCYIATGHSCWGILNGPATGASLAELILNGKSTTVNLAPFSPARFLRLRTRK